MSTKTGQVVKTIAIGAAAGAAATAATLIVVKLVKTIRANNRQK